MLLKISKYSHENTYVRLRDYNVIKKRLQYKCFPVNITNFKEQLFHRTHLVAASECFRKCECLECQNYKTTLNIYLVDFHLTDLSGRQQIIRDSDCLQINQINWRSQSQPNFNISSNPTLYKVESILEAFYTFSLSSSKFS